MDTSQVNTEPVVKEVTVDAPAERVWKAITDKDEMKQWYFDIESFKPEVGFEFQFTGENEGRKFVHLCKILEVVPGKKLKHSWKYEGHPGESFVTFELFEENGKTRVRLTHEGLESFGGGADFAKENFVAGWNEIIGTRLKEYVEKK
jgi:uncharacterized protein YndB with AHSA1/START domain